MAPRTTAAVNKYTCGGWFFFRGQFFFCCLYGMPPYFNMFIFQVSGNLNIFYSLLIRALLVKSPCSASLKFRISMSLGKAHKIYIPSEI